MIKKCVLPVLLLILVLLLTIPVHGAWEGNIQEKLEKIGQVHLLRYLDTIPSLERELLISQIDQLDVNEFLQQRQALSPVEHSKSAFSPLQEFYENGSVRNKELGQQIISQGKVGCLIIVESQPSDALQCTLPITVIKHKSTLQLLAEKVKAASKQAERPLLIAIMTCLDHQQEMKDFFEQNCFFGLQRDQVFWLRKNELPLLDEQGRIFLDSCGKVATSPEGNAAALKQFVQSGIWSEWNHQGIRYLNYLHADNPLADPFDPELTGFHHRHQVELVIKCVTRNDATESVGIILNKNNKLHVLDYAEIPLLEREARYSNGALKHICANINSYSFKMDFIQEVAFLHYDALPFHKRAIISDQMSKYPLIWKFDKLIFDVVSYASSAKVLHYPREYCFAPLKTVRGTNNVAEVQKALQKFDRQAFVNITGMNPPLIPFELDPEFYYPTILMLSDWKTKSFPKSPSSYIVP